MALGMKPSPKALTHAGGAILKENNKDFAFSVEDKGSKPPKIKSAQTYVQALKSADSSINKI